MIDARRPRPLLQLLAQRQVLIGRTRGHHLHIAVVAVAYPASDAGLCRLPLHEPAKAYALHAAGYNVMAGLKVGHDHSTAVGNRSRQLAMGEAEVRGLLAPIAAAAESLVGIVTSRPRNWRRAIGT